MKHKERLEKFLELQKKNKKFEDISKELGVTPSTLRKYLNKTGYKCVSGKYVLEDTNNNTNKIAVSRANSKVKVKKDRKINITQEDLDKLCEVYDWYLNVKDNKSIKQRNQKSSKKDIKVEDTNLTSLKSTSIKVDKDVWAEFERLCSNSQYTKQQIITQALKDFMKTYKNLL